MKKKIIQDTLWAKIYNKNTQTPTSLCIRTVNSGLYILVQLQNKQILTVPNFNKSTTFHGIAEQEMQIQNQINQNLHNKKQK